ncbi:unnamed protein product [Ambrosiozyma monospora]|uniref:Unnamed protein product n=1 Tax=Ambrosiozyma monospora TaxID=43982 RepID=A0ACB5TVW3_AMBMO|nr:unnamed protein product [Ambrosiozyma monospora]
MGPADYSISNELSRELQENNHTSGTMSSDNNNNIDNNDNYHMVMMDKLFATSNSQVLQEDYRLSSSVSHHLQPPTHGRSHSHSHSRSQSHSSSHSQQPHRRSGSSINNNLKELDFLNMAYQSSGSNSAPSPISNVRSTSNLINSNVNPYANIPPFSSHFDNTNQLILNPLTSVPPSMFMNSSSHSGASSPPNNLTLLKSQFQAYTQSQLQQPNRNGSVASTTSTVSSFSSFSSPINFTADLESPDPSLIHPLTSFPLSPTTSSANTAKISHVHTVTKV